MYRDVTCIIKTLSCQKQAHTHILGYHKYPYEWDSYNEEYGIQ